MLGAGERSEIAHRRLPEHIKVSWKEQAAGKARDYLDYTHFSRASLIRQLTYEGFTQSQAEYAAKEAGL